MKLSFVAGAAFDINSIHKMIKTHNISQSTVDTIELNDRNGHNSVKYNIIY